VRLVTASRRVDYRKEPKVATKYISKVRMVPSGGILPHEHIGYVMLSDGTVEARATVIYNITYGRDRYYTNANPPASVYVHPCPFCGASDYITTHPDGTATNNLLHLPKF
jgi:hypothetical protein